MKYLYLGKLNYQEAEFNILHEDLYKDLPNLTELLLQNNYIKTVPANCFPKQANLKWLTIQDCPIIGKIDKNAFSNLYALEKISMLSCRLGLATLNKSSFKGLSKLEKIDLSYNSYPEGHVFGFDGIPENIIFNM